MPSTQSVDQTMRARVINGGGLPPDYVEYRYCPKDPFHWKTENERCPVCKSKIKAAIFIYQGEAG